VQVSTEQNAITLERNTERPPAARLGDVLRRRCSARRKCCRLPIGCGYGRPIGSSGAAEAPSPRRVVSDRSPVRRSLMGFSEVVILCGSGHVTVVRFAWFTGLARAAPEGGPGGGVAVGDGHLLVHRP
jgi:hypothetical protein